MPTTMPINIYKRFFLWCAKNGKHDLMFVRNNRLVVYPPWKKPITLKYYHIQKAFWLACIHSHLETAQWLYDEFDVDIDVTSGTYGEQKVVQCESLEIVRWINDVRAKGYCYNFSTHLLKLACKYNINCDAFDSCDLLIKRILKHYDGEDDEHVYILCKYGQTAILETYWNKWNIDTSIDYNLNYVEFVPPLQTLIRNGHEDATQYFLNYCEFTLQYDVKAIINSVFVRDICGFSGSIQLIMLCISKYGMSLHDKDSCGNNGFYYAVLNGKLDVAKWMLRVKEGIINSSDIKELFSNVLNYTLVETKCGDNALKRRLETLKWLKDQFNIEIVPINYEYACKHSNDEDIIRWIGTFVADDVAKQICTNVFNSTLNNMSICSTCNPEDMIKIFVLYRVCNCTVTMHANAAFHDIFNRICSNKRMHLEYAHIAVWMSAKMPEDYYVKCKCVSVRGIEHYNYLKITEYKILRLLPRVSSVLVEVSTSEICAICNELQSNVITKCCHQFCYECLNTWYAKKRECPLCRTPVTTVAGLCVAGSTCVHHEP